MLPVDIARIYNESQEAAEARIERGRNKMQAWLGLVDRLETFAGTGCSRCGSPKCSGGHKCDIRIKSVAAVQDQLPLEEVVQMNTAKWYAAVQAKHQGSLAFSIDLDTI